MTLSRVPGAARNPFSVAEFFAGIGLARLGLEQAGFAVGWANDIEFFKHDMYALQFGKSSDYHLGDVASVKGESLPQVDLAWSSFPCTDLSLAGTRAGLAGASSSTFYEFTRVLEEMSDRRPRAVVVENVVGLATSHGGDDMTAAIRSLNNLGYSVDLLLIDARRFVPQSRPRLFIVGALDAPESVEDPNSEMRPDVLQTFYGDPTLTMHKAALPRLPLPLIAGLSKVVENLPADDSRWWDAARTSRFLSSMSQLQAGRLASFKNSGEVVYRTAYRRTRDGVAVWEVRPDDISGCLRTARGGSSKQAVVRIAHGEIRVRWMTPREYARLMGAPDYPLDGIRDAQALFGFGDAVCAPVVSWVGENYIQPLLKGALVTSARRPVAIA